MQLIKSILAIAAISVGATSALKYNTVVDMAMSGFSKGDFVSPIVSYANGSVWVGDIKSQVYSEPFTSSGRGYIYFTSYHQTPTGGQYAYIFPNDTKPLGLTIPHSSSLPAGTNATDQAFNCNGSPCSVSPRGNYLNFYGENKFIGCQDEAAAAIRSYKVYWGGGAAAPEGLNCTGPLYIYQYKELS